MKSLVTTATVLVAGAVVLSGCSSSSKSASSSTSTSPTAAASASTSAAATSAAPSASAPTTASSAAATTAASSPAAASGPVVQLTMWTGFTGSDGPSYQALVDQFNASHPSIHVTMTIQPWATLGQKLPQAWATGTGPDIATPSSDPGSIFNYISNNEVVPLDPDVGSGATQIDSAAFPSSVTKAFSVGGKLYAVPANMATLVLYYNKTLFAKAGITAAPTTQADFIADAKKLTSGGTYGLTLADNNTIQMWPILQWMNGGDIIDSNGCATIQQPASVQALTTWSQLVENDHISPIGQTGAQSDTLFSAGKAAMEINGPWAAGTFRTAGINLGIAQVPVGSAGPVTLLSTVPMMVAKSSKHQAQAEQFLAWYTGKTAQLAFAQKSGFPPVRTDMTSETYTNPDVSIFSTALPTGKLYLAGQSSATEIDSDVYVPLIGKITRGANVQSSVNAAATAINKLTGCKS
jgi:multiple sugar transport system substrate-binding protein